MGKTREIKTRIRATSNIKRITKTMQMIATAKFQAAQKDVLAAQPFADKIAELVSEVAASGGDSDRGPIHPLLRQAREPKKQLLLVITSNRGLCGAYNSHVLREAMGLLDQHESDAIDVEVTGKKAVSYFRFAGRAIDKIHDMGDKPSYADVEALANDFMARFEAGEYDAVRVASMRFESMSRQTPQVISLLPLEDPSQTEDANIPGRGTEPSTHYEFSPDPEALLGRLLPVSVRTRLFQCFQEAALSENLARMVAMQGATDAADKMGKRLTREYNRARQAAITTELSEIIAGSMALSS